MDEGWDVQLHQLLEEGVPPLLVAHGRVSPVPATGVGVEHAAHETQLVDRALELGDGILRWDARRLRQLRHADEIVRV